MIEDILEYNKRFVENKGYEKYITNKYPDKKIAILSCMDTRLTELLPAALGIKNGDVKWWYLQPIITQYFIDNKSEIWLLFLIAHSKR